MSDAAPAPVRVLIVEDRAVDAELAEREVKRALSHCTFARVDTADSYLAALDTFQPDLILSDYALPAFDGLAAVRLAREHAPLTPVIIVTAAINEDTAVECMKAGAVDYVIKEHIKRLGQAVVQALEQKKVRQARRQAEHDLRIKSFAVESSTAAICLGDLEGRIFYANDAFRQLAQCETREQILGRSIAEFVESPDEAQAKLEALRRMKRHNATGRFRGRDGSMVDVQVSGSVVTSQDGQPLCLMGAFVDLSERRALEDSLRRNIAENRAILDAVPDVFFRVSGDGTVLGYHAHHGSEGVPAFGWIPGQHIGQALPEPVAARVQEAVQSALTTGTVVDFEYGLGSGSEQRDFEARVVSAAEGEALVIVRDITARKHAEAERERLRAAARADPQDGVDRPARRRHRPRLQQHAHGGARQRGSDEDADGEGPRRSSRKWRPSSRRRCAPRRWRGSCWRSRGSRSSRPSCSISTRRSPRRTRCSRRSSASTSRWTSGPPPACGRCSAIRRRSIRCC